MMRSYGKEPLTPRMKIALLELQAGSNLTFSGTSVGRPTKQRLAKFGLAAFDVPKDWDGPMHLTNKGLRLLQTRLGA